MELIEAAATDDIPHLVDLLGLLFAQEADFEPAADKQRRALHLIIASPRIGVIFVVREEKEIVGMVSLLFTISTAEGGPACWLEDMIVRPDRRGNGVGSRLLKHAIGYARAHGFRRITLLTEKVNADAIRFYKRNGFVVSSMTALRFPLPAP